MGEQQLTARQLGIWLLAAISGPLTVAAGAGWAVVALAAGAVLPLARISGDGWRSLNKGAALLEAVWLCVLGGLLLKNSAVFWPGSRSEWVVPITLAALAFLTKSECAPGVCAVVGMCLAVLYAVILVGGAAQAKGEWLRPCPGEWTWTLIVAMLLPALWGLWRNGTHKRGHALFASAVVGILFAAVTQGILSPTAASLVPDAFYEMSRAMELGILSRIEPVAATASALGWYALAAYCQTSAVRLAMQAGFAEMVSRCTALLIVIGVVVFDVVLPGYAIVGLCILLWVAIPVCAEKRNFKKDEKRC